MDGVPLGCWIVCSFSSGTLSCRGAILCSIFFIMFQIFGLQIWPSLAILIWGFFENLHIIFPKKGGVQFGKFPDKEKSNKIYKKDGGVDDDMIV